MTFIIDLVIGSIIGVSVVLTGVLGAKYELRNQDKHMREKGGMINS